MPPILGHPKQVFYIGLEQLALLEYHLTLSHAGVLWPCPGTPNDKWNPRATEIPPGLQNVGQSIEHEDQTNKNSR